MTAKEKDELIVTINSLPNDVSQAEFAEELLVCNKAMEALMNPSDEDMTHEQVKEMVNSWK